MATKKEKKDTLAAAAQKAKDIATPGVEGESSSGDKPSFAYSPYTPSEGVKQALSQLQQQQSAKPGAYASGWRSQLEDIMGKLQNREKFSYDLNGDALYQQYKDAYTQQGKLAMLDTMGQAQAMTGGYGNSYAQNVGQQAYQSSVQQLGDRIPELYQLALDQYNREGDAMYDRASLLAGMEERDYGRYRDQVSDYYTQLDRLTNDARYQAEQDYGKWMDKTNLDYGIHRDTVADRQWQAQFDEAKRQYDEQMALTQSKSSRSGGTVPVEKEYVLLDAEQEARWRGYAEGAKSIGDLDSIWGRMENRNIHPDEIYWVLGPYYDKFAPPERGTDVVPGGTAGAFGGGRIFAASK